jgi:hypothetical protein
MKFSLTGFLLIFCWMISAAQLPQTRLAAPLLQLQQYLKKNVPPGFDSIPTKNPLYTTNGLNYLQPLYKQFSPQKDSSRIKIPVNYSILAQDFSFAGDYGTAVEYGSRGYDSLSLEAYGDAKLFVDTMKNVQFRDAHSYIISRAAGEKIVMLNEAHHQSLHRAFAMELLEDLYKLGFRYFAMEMLNSRKDGNLTDIDMRTGYFAAEPVAGELIRKAVSLGYKLIAYEDTLANNHTGSGRDAIQAGRIATVLQQDPSAKIFVFAGNAHIGERRIGNDYTPMAAFFKRLTGIDPFTIDQTEMSEGSTFEYGRYFYSILSTAKNIIQPSIAFRNEIPVSLVENDLYDIQIIHPSCKYIHNRPDWLLLNGHRKELAVRPTEKTLYLVQAYYLEETNKKPIPILVPADQTYITDRDGYYWLFLVPGKYKIILRDIDYRILNSRETTVTN